MMKRGSEHAVKTWCSSVGHQKVDQKPQGRHGRPRVCKRDDQDIEVRERQYSRPFSTGNTHTGLDVHVSECSYQVVKVGSKFVPM